jgi:energy-coupling factor transport system ATP-binding protein
MALIEFRNFSFTYALSSEKALDGVDFTVEEGDFAVLFGPSGCGKSTLLRQLKRELTPAGRCEGSLLYNGTALETQPPGADEIGFVQQNPDSQIVTDTVAAELAFGPESLGLPPERIRRRVAEMAGFFGIGSWFHRRTDTLSGGQKQLLNLAAVLCMQPRLLLLDEPTAQLDPIAAREFVTMVSRLNREFGMTVLLTGHRLDDVLPLATRAAFMQGGRVRLCCPPRELPARLMKTAPAFLPCLPAASRIYTLARPDGGDCPLTVAECRRYVQSVCKAQTRKPAPGQPAPKSNRPPVLACDAVYFGYGETDVLADLSLPVYPGETLCLLGENGSGKSTLLALLAGLRRPRRGRVTLAGRSLARLCDREKYLHGIALLPQDPRALFTCPTVGEELRSAGPAPADAEALAEELKLTPLLGRHPYDLSGGEQQKAAMAKLLLTRPRILLLDEPTKGLDALAKADFAALLRRVRGSGAALVLATHDMEFAAENADRCVLLSDGRVACDESPRLFFGGNYFFTTPAGRIARGIDPAAVTCGDVVRLCKEAVTE